MSRIAYVNGRYVPLDAAQVHVEDRGFQFADGAYEVFAVRGGRLVEADAHWRRLARSLAELSIAPPMSQAAMSHIAAEVVRRNRVADGLLYLQVTRGRARRDFPFPKGVEPSIVMTARSQKPPDPELVRRGVAVITLPDIRWARRDIKSVSLLPNVLAKQRAKEAGAYEAWLIDGEGRITEGASSNAWIVTEGGEIVTPACSPSILAGVTRGTLVTLAQSQGLSIAERPFTLAEAFAAREAFLTSSSNTVMPVVRIDGKPVGAGVPGTLAVSLRQLYDRHVGGAA
jgi:D-alanine transaminase